MYGIGFPERSGSVSQLAPDADPATDEPPHRSQAVRDVKASELAAWFAAAPPDVEFEVTIRALSNRGPLTSTERSRLHRGGKPIGPPAIAMQRNATLAVASSQVGGMGGQGPGSDLDPAERAEKKPDPMLASSSQVSGAGETGASMQRDATLFSLHDTHIPAGRSGVGVARVWEAWRQDTGHHRASLDPKRKRRIEARLREGFTPERLILAITNRRNDPFLMGQNPTGRLFDGLDTLLRDAAQVERLEALTEPTTGIRQQRHLTDHQRVFARAARLNAEYDAKEAERARTITTEGIAAE